ncbi:MAG: hypothetical protein O3C67_04520 [Cyanobacteria bacterium]|nr:hypothetical protein [Cyanobacteriota bacterium]
MSSRPDPSHARNRRRAINAIVLLIALGLLLSNLGGAIAASFQQGVGPGIRSLAAAGVPLLAAFYVGYINRLKVPANHRGAPVVNSFVMFTLWTLLLFWVDGQIDLPAFPLQELLYSCTLAFMVWRYQRPRALRTLAACGYGVIVGWLGTLILFGAAAIA